MKGILEFDLSDLDDTRAFKRANAANDMYSVLFQFSETLREHVKHAEGEEIAVVDNWRVSLQELLEDHGIILEDLG